MLRPPIGFVGRQPELRVLAERLGAARMGEPQVVYVEGDPGAGKSTLLSRFFASLSDAVVLESGCDEAETMLSYGVIDQLQAGVVTEPGTDPMVVGARLLELFDRLQAGDQVVVLAIDDLQWADRPSSRALLFALRRLRADRVLTVVAARASELTDPGWARFLGGDTRVSRLRLGGLTAGDLTELAEALGLGLLSQRGASRLAAHTEGNALYCRALLDEIGVVQLSAGDGGLPAPRDLSAVRSGVPSSYPGTCLAHLSDAYFRRGDWDAAVAYAELASSLAQDSDRPVDLARGHARAAQVLAVRGEWAEAQAHLNAARAAVERLPLVLAVAAAATAAVSLASARGDLAGVLRATEPVRATRLLGVGGRPGIFNWRAIEADALIALGRLGDAELALDEFEGAVPRPGLRSAALMLARCRGNLAVASGDAAQAAAMFERAHVIQTDVSMPFEHAVLSLDDGRRLRAAGNRPAAIAQLEAAHRLFSDLGAEPYVQACARELASLQVTAAIESPAALLGLSRAEVAVARLVATGLTNREVANQLYVSVKTVEYHLRNIYLKLDITSRRTLTALLR